MRTRRLCSTCSCERRGEAHAGRCAGCIAGAAGAGFESEGEPSARDGAVFGRYRLGPRIGSGGMGVVHRARDLLLGREVALKLLRGGEHAGALASSLFQEEVRAFARLDHPNVVPIYEAGEHEGQLYFTMKLFPGDLKAQLGRFEADPAGAAELVEKIALAVRHLHQHGILHRDLKPANILLDDASPPNPHVADFGVARLIGEDSQYIRTGAIVGTPHYMAPEQAAGKDVTWAADVYGLGVILYELLVRELPYPGDCGALARARQRPPLDPRALDPRVDRDLARVCLRCLELEPERRYPSAAALAQALRRYLNGEPFEGAGRLLRAWRWCLRHSVIAGVILGALLFLLLVTFRAVTLIAEQQATRRAQVLQTNMHSAARIAGAVLAHIRTLSDAVALAAADAALAAASADGDRNRMQRFCKQTFDDYEDPVHGLKAGGSSPFDKWFVLDNAGVLQAQYGKLGHRGRLGSSYVWRDYFSGARRRGERRWRSTHVSRAFRSETDGEHKFAISAPIYGADGRPSGVIVASVAAGPNLGPLVLDDGQRTAVLVAPSDRERVTGPGWRPHIGLIHPGLRRGEAVGVASEEVRRAGGDPETWRPFWPSRSERLTASHGYSDPVAAANLGYRGRWSAGFAPVGNTGFVVIVQSREDEAMKPELALVQQMAPWTAVSAVPGALLVLFAAVYSRRRRPQRV